MTIIQAQVLDLGSLKELSEQLSSQIQVNNKFLLGLFFVTGFDILLLAFRIWSDFSIKNLDKKIHSANLKETKRISIYEQLYSMMNDITYIDPRDSNRIINEVTALERFFNANFLYIPSDVEKIIFTFTDYNKLVSTDITKKDFDTEVQIVSALKDYFTKN